ncbi:hypothetical protein ACJMK2_044568 [Sinanodonta woodiana]|uniref:VWFA domain-containing protein n=1 Tax=Sinanodonta woodiana TaxID=1069815 RepID=A0ABD3W0H6_SINWO
MCSHLNHIIIVRARTRYKESIRKGERFSLDGDNDYDVKIPILINSLNKLVNRMDTINHRLEAENIVLCDHACNHEREGDKSHSTSCSDIVEYADDKNSGTMKSTNYGKLVTQEEVVDDVVMHSRMQITPQDGKYERMLSAPYSLPQIENKSVNVSEQKSHTTTNIGILSKETISKGTNHLHDIPKRLDIKQVRNKTDEESKAISSAAVIHTDSSGLKSIQTDPTKDNRRKYIKERVQFITGNNKVVKQHQQTNKNMNLNHGFGLKKEGDLLEKHSKSADIQKKEIQTSQKIHPTKGHKDAEGSIVKTKIDVDQDSVKQDNRNISGPTVSVTNRTPQIPNEPIMPLAHLPEEYWSSLLQETHEKAQKIKATRPIGLNTIICLDTSMSVAEYWGDILEFLRNLIHEIDLIQPMEGGLLEHIAVVTFGHETCVLQHFSTDYQEVLTKIHLINPDGSTPMHWVLLLCEAILSNNRVPILRDFILDARLLIITDGRPTQRFVTGGQDVPFRPDEEEMEKEEIARQLILLYSLFPLLRVYPVTVGNNCDMEFLSALADLSGGKVMTLSDWPVMAHFGKKLELTSKYFGLASLPGNVLANVLTEKSGLPQEEIEFITCAIKDQIKVQNEEGYTSDEEKTKGSYQFPPVGSRVRRGPDWNRKDEDNDSPGTLYGYAKGEAFAGWVMVQWDNPKKYGRWRFRYRYGAENAHDIEVQANEGPKKMDSLKMIRTGCEVIRRKYTNTTDNEVDDVDAGSIGMVYDTLNIGRVIEVKVRWHNGIKRKYRNSAMELELSPRSCRNPFGWPYAPLPPFHNPHIPARQPSLDVSRQDLPRQDTLPPSWGQSMSGQIQHSSAGAIGEKWDSQSSSRDAMEEITALTKENVKHPRMPSVDDMNSRNVFLSKKKESMNKQTFGKTKNSSSNTILESREEVKSDKHKVTQQAELCGNQKQQRPKKSNKNNDACIN